MLVAILWASASLDAQGEVPRSDRVAGELGLESARSIVGDFVAEGDGILLRTRDRYDCVAAIGNLHAAHATIELELTHLDGLAGGGLVFASREIDRAPKFAHMLRFDGPGELLFGAFVRGQFEADGRITLPAPVPRGTRTTLTLQIDAVTRKLAVSVDGTTVATDLPLRSTVGGVFLQGSMGRVRFHALRAHGRIGTPHLAWPTAFVALDGVFVVRSALGTFALPRDGGPPRLLSDWTADLPAMTELGGARIVAGIVILPSGAAFRGTALGTFDAVALALDRDGTLLALDQYGGRIVAVPSRGDESADLIRFPARDAVQVVPPRPAFICGTDGRLAGSTDPLGIVGGLAASTAYRLHYPLPFRVWPADLAFRSIPFTTPPRPGLMRVRRLHVVVGLFGNVADEDEDAALLPAATPLDFARLENEIAATVAWYFHHSGYRLWIEPHFVRRSERTTTRALSASGEANGEPPRALLVELSEQAGIPLGEVAGFCVVVDAKTRTAADRPWQRIGGGGGLTLGAHGTGYGRSWFFVPPTPGMVSWLFCHELHHQIDALFEISGLPAYPFNHFAPALRNVAFFGEHWDGNAWILRTWPSHLWDALRFGDDVLVADGDDDGLPDADPRLPFDEARFGSDPRSADTDGDGVGDAAEAGTGRWLLESGFESQLGPRLDPNPRRPDTDADGLDDATDPLPLLPFDPRIQADEPRVLRSIDDPRLRVATVLAVVDGALEIRSTSPDAAVLETRLLIDLQADGWFAGRDNLRIQARADHGRVVELFDASSTTAWPHADAVRARDFTVECRVADDTQIVRVVFPEPLRAAATFALAIGYRGRLHPPDDPRWLSLFEPHRLVRFAIAGPEDR